MLKCQNISTFKKMLYCLFLFRLLNYVLETLRIFPKPRQEPLRFFISLRLLSLCHDGRWFESCYAEISVDHPLHTSRPTVSQGFQHAETVCKRLQIECHPCKLIFPFPPPPLPHFLLFLSFPQFSRKWACSQAISLGSANSLQDIIYIPVDWKEILQKCPFF